MVQVMAVQQQVVVLVVVVQKIIQMVDQQHKFQVQDL